VPAVSVAVCLALLAAACGPAASSHVAQLGTSTSQSSSPSSGSTHERALAYSRCMRSNGVLGYPDPDSSGGTDKTKVTAARADVGSSRFDGAQDACRHLLPPSSPGPTPAEVQQAMNGMQKFARCMRSHGVSDWPDPHPDVGRPTFDLHGLDYKAPRISTAIRECQHLMPGSTLPRMCSSLLGTPGNEGCFGGSARVP
jgi:hypothetical protein